MIGVLFSFFISSLFIDKMRAYQNLNHGQPKNKHEPATMQFHCKWCSKKYKTQKKHDAHVDKMHPFAAINKNTKEFTLEEKFWLLDEMEKYVLVLLQNNQDTFLEATANLGEPDRMLPIHTLFKERIVPHLNKVMSNGPQLLRILDEFRAFLNLGLTKRGDNFCPSLLIDLVWHGAMQNKDRYFALTSRFLGGALPHCLFGNDGDESRFQEFLRQFEHQHGRPYLKVQDLILGDGNGFEHARNVLKTEDKMAKRKIAEQDARWKAYYDEIRASIAAQKAAGIYVEPVYYDDGKC